MSDQKLEETMLEQQETVSTEAEAAPTSKKESKIKNFFKGYKSFKSLSVTSKVIHIAIPLLCVIFIIGLLGDEDNLTLGVSVIKSSQITGYEFDITLDDFIDNWNETQVELDQLEMKDLSIIENDGSTVYYMFEPGTSKAIRASYGKQTVVIGISVCNDSGNITGLTCSISKDFLDTLTDESSANVSSSYLISTFGCLGGSYIELFKKTLDENPYYNDNVYVNSRTQVDSSTTQTMETFSIRAMSKDFYNNMN